ncbi:MAG: lytic transglycosylase domain-containing protein [Bacillota bacterium]|nr:lytic transglycosylase domain-containing protein [Bacillota bacterium]MDW7683270.1 lytic transglycosylase domain-containing protein [Bacillota bacterium]
MADMTKWVRVLLFALVMTTLLLAFWRTPQVGRLLYPYSYREIIEENAAEYGVDPLLVAAVIRVESKYDPDAVSPRGALGLMQLMPATAEWIAPQVGIDTLTEEMLLDPKVNIKLGTWYLANLSEEFSANLDVVLASYNGGRGQVKRWLDEGIWSGRYADRSEIPFSETRLFLYKVKKAYGRYQELYR